MNEIELGDSGLRSPQIGFGCSALLGRSGRKESLRALAAAWDEGIRFFDTARSYGYGESEALLGEFLAGRRDQAVVATKFGILPARQSGVKEIAKSIARGILAVAPAAHSILQRRAAGQFSADQFTLPVLRQSIEESLRKLRTDYVDLLFFHSAPASVLEQDDLLEAMGRLVETGKVKVAGLSGDPSVVEFALESEMRPLRAMQFPCNVFEISAALRFTHRAASGHLMVANHPFGGVARVHECHAILKGLALRQDLAAGLRSKLENADASLLPDVVLNVILRGTGIHVVIPAMMKLEHIRANIRALTNSRFDSAEIEQIREVLSKHGA
jgi:aryl-alcohol dehydrogenase-like predicted oxidoreductase